MLLLIVIIILSFSVKYLAQLIAHCYIIKNNDDFNAVDIRPSEEGSGANSRNVVYIVVLETV